MLPTAPLRPYPSAITIAHRACLSVAVSLVDTHLVACPASIDATVPFAIARLRSARLTANSEDLLRMPIRDTSDRHISDDCFGDDHVCGHDISDEDISDSYISDAYQ